MATGNSVLTSPLATIIVNGVISGYMQGITLNENITRVKGRQLGALDAFDNSPVAFDATLNADYLFIDFNKAELSTFIDRQHSTSEILNTLKINNIPVSIVIFKKDAGATLGNIVTLVNDQAHHIGTIKDFSIESQNLNITQGQLAASNISGSYLTPISNTGASSTPSTSGTSGSTSGL